MNTQVETKIDKLIEEANEKVKESVAKWRGGDFAFAFPHQLIAMPGFMHAGYKAGRELGHPVAGLFTGQEGAAGARSNWDPTVTIGDVYTPKNFTKRTLQMLPAAALGGALGGGPGGAVIGATLAPIMGAIAPGLNYGLGKVFGSKNPSKDRTI
jgi:hypothetical protein